MSDGILVACITAVATIIGQWLISKSQHDKDNAVLNERLDGIKTRLDTHNHYAERLGDLADGMNELKVDMAEIKTDVNWLKNEVRK